MGSAPYHPTSFLNVADLWQTLDDFHALLATWLIGQRLWERAIHMISDVQKLLDQYWAWLKDKTKLREIDGNWVEITTPHIDRHNDYLQIYARRQNGTFGSDRRWLHDQ